MARFNDAGRPREEIMRELEQGRKEDFDWRQGRTAAYSFSASQEVSALGKDAFNAYFSENALGARRAFPSLLRMERDVIAMGLDLFHGAPNGAGNMTSGGTESIVMAVKSCRDRSRQHRGDAHHHGNMVIPMSAHPAFEKAAALMDIGVRRVPLTGEFVADPMAMANATDSDTILLVGSAPCFSYGTIDPIAALSELAQERGIWLHVDACVGGWIAPFVADIGRPIPEFDFGLPGVMSLSADLHKFGFCPKPASAIFYRDAAAHAFQEFAFGAWPSGRFVTQTLVGTRSGGAVAAAWAVLNHLGRDGYRRIAADLMQVRDAYIEGLLAISGMRIRGEPALCNIAFGCDDIDMGSVATLMAESNWLPGVVRDPSSLHIMLSMHHAASREAYLKDAARCVDIVRRGNAKTGTTEANYA
jgi:sphinganine-1-phosphate aldolase